MPTSAVPQPLPPAMASLGNAYSLRASGSMVQLGQLAVLRLFYEPNDLPVGVNPEALRIARWNGTAWQVLPSEPDPERFAVIARTNQLGIFSLMAPAETSDVRRVFLPRVAK